MAEERDQGRRQWGEGSSNKERFDRRLEGSVGRSAVKDETTRDLEVGERGAWVVAANGANLVESSNLALLNQVLNSDKGGIRATLEAYPR